MSTKVVVKSQGGSSSPSSQGQYPTMSQAPRIEVCVSIWATTTNGLASHCENHHPISNQVCWNGSSASYKERAMIDSDIPSRHSLPACGGHLITNMNRDISHGTKSDGETNILVRHQIVGVILGLILAGCVHGCVTITAAIWRMKHRAGC